MNGFNPDEFDKEMEQMKTQLKDAFTQPLDSEEFQRRLDAIRTMFEQPIDMSEEYTTLVVLAPQGEERPVSPSGSLFEVLYVAKPNQAGDLYLTGRFVGEHKFYYDGSFHDVNNDKGDGKYVFMNRKFDPPLEDEEEFEFSDSDFDDNDSDSEMDVEEVLRRNDDGAVRVGSLYDRTAVKHVNHITKYRRNGEVIKRVEYRVDYKRSNRIPISF